MRRDKEILSDNREENKLGDLLKAVFLLPYWSIIGILSGIIISITSFSVGYKVYSESLTVKIINFTSKSNVIDISLRNDGNKSAFVSGFKLDILSSNISKGTCKYVPSDNYVIKLNTENDQPSILNNGSIYAELHQEIQPGGIDRIKLTFEASKDGCIFIDIIGRAYVEYSINSKKVLEIENVTLSF